MFIVNTTGAIKFFMGVKWLVNAYSILNFDIQIPQPVYLKTTEEYLHCQRNYTEIVF